MNHERYDSPERSTHHSLFVLPEHISREQDRRHCCGPSRVEREVRYQFDDFVLRDAIFKGTTQMERQLLGSVESNKGRYGNEAAVPFGKSGSFPNVSEENIVGEFSELWCNVAN